jgi:predicted transcriptional regulator
MSAATARVDPEAFRRALRERCLTGEDVRREARLSPSTLAKVYRGEPVTDSVFRRLVLELQRHPVQPVAEELIAREAS